MNTQRFNLGWNTEQPNGHWFGLADLIRFVIEHTSSNKWPLPLGDNTPFQKLRMLEIGSYMGESTSMFAASNAFQGTESFNEENNYDWEFIEKEFNNNTRYFDNITLYKDYSYNTVDKFQDGYFDFIYIDANHTYEDVKRDLELYLPKLKKGGLIGGHDYYVDWEGVVKAVNEVVGKPDKFFWDTSWIKYEI